MEFQSRQNELDPYIKEANLIVDGVINNALSIHEKYLIPKDPETQEEVVKELSSKTSDTTGAEMDIENRVEKYDTAGKIPNIKWLTAKEFSIQAGKEKIDEFLKTWERDESWLYCIDFLGEEEHECDFRYRYRVMWSIPTRRKPIPRATASVYFTMKVNKFRPKTFPVDVYFIFETNSLVHRPDESRFQQKWLKDIIDSKVILMDDIRF